MEAFADIVEGDDFYSPWNRELQILVISELERKFGDDSAQNAMDLLTRALAANYRKYRARV